MAVVRDTGVPALLPDTSKYARKRLYNNPARATGVQGRVGSSASGLAHIVSYRGPHALAWQSSEARGRVRGSAVPLRWPAALPQRKHDATGRTAPPCAVIRRAGAAH
eukprot:6199982-Pleurochrysis_carterae.AAC.2